MTSYLKVQDPFDKNRKVKALRPTIKMGGTTTRNGKEVDVGMSKEWLRRNKPKSKALDSFKADRKFREGYSEGLRGFK